MSYNILNTPEKIILSPKKVNKLKLPHLILISKPSTKITLLKCLSSVFYIILYRSLIKKYYRQLFNIKS